MSVLEMPRQHISWHAALRPLLLVAGAFALQGCGSITVSARHSPLYRGDTHLSTIAATARSSAGVSRIDIEVTTGETVSCTALEGPDLPGLMPCRAAASTITHSCTFPAAPTTASCAFNQSLGPRSLVTYRATAVPGRGSTAQSNFVTYAGGTPPVEWVSWWDWFPFPSIETAAWQPLQPIWWEVEEPQQWMTDLGRLDIGFHADPDYGSDRNAYWNDLQNIILRTYFNSAQTFAQDYTLWRTQFALWAGAATANAEPGTTLCTKTVTGGTSGYTDGDVIVHRTAFRDCADISFGGTGTVAGGMVTSAEIFVHESGHFLLGLGDEYCCNGGHYSIATPPNVYTTLKACEDSATELGFATTLCIRNANADATVVFWRIDDGTPEIMEDERILGEDWNDSSYRAFTNRIARCINGHCY